MELQNTIVNNFAVDEPIFVDDIERLFPDRSRPWIDKAIRQLVDDKTIKRYSTGVFYIPRKTIIGESILNPQKIIAKKYIKNSVDVYGYLSGISLLNSVGLTTQVPNMINIVSNKESSRGRKVSVGNQSAYVSRSEVDINSENQAVLQFLEIVKTSDPNDFDDIETDNLRRYIKENNVDLKSVSEYCRYFPDYVSKRILGGNLIELLA